jgi:hypothetical protein
MSQELEDLESRIHNYFIRHHLSWALDQSDGEIYDLIVKRLYGETSRDPMIPINWKGIFEGNQCPVCKQSISLKEDEYLCSACGFTIPLVLYDRACEEYKNKKKLREEDKKLMDEARAKNINPRVLDGLYKKAMEEAYEKIKNDITQVKDQP